MQMASLSAMVIMTQDLARTFGGPSKRMMPVGFHIEVEESFYVLFEARRHPVTPRQAGIPPEAVTNGNGRSPGVGDSLDCAANQLPEQRRISQVCF